jgi:hypothetical protein
VSDKSPLFVSSLELIAHATELFAQKHPKKYKFIILHLANAIELVLKDLLIDQGMSIYKPGTNKTIDIWECIGKLKAQGVDLPELPIIELLIDDRNTIQHRFGYPTAEAITYYIEQVTSFFRRFLDQHYGVQLVEALEPHLSTENLKLLGLVKDEYGYLEKLASISPKASITQIYSIIEKQLTELLAPYAYGAVQMIPIWRNRYLPLLFRDLASKGYVTRDMSKDFNTLREARNFAAHSSDLETSSVDLQEAFTIAKELLNGLEKASQSGYAFVPEQNVKSAEDQPKT